MGLKDPRMCRLLPLWFPLFQKLAIDPCFALMIRHPWEVASSLAKRDDVGHGKSYLLWLQHTLEAETATRGHKRAIVDYGELLKEPVTVLRRLRSELELRSFCLLHRQCKSRFASFFSLLSATRTKRGGKMRIVMPRRRSSWKLTRQCGKRYERKRTPRGCRVNNWREAWSSFSLAWLRLAPHSFIVIWGVPGKCICPSLMIWCAS